MNNSIVNLIIFGTCICIMIGGPYGTGGVHAWGGLFNRFSPEMLANMGYGGNGYNSQPTSYLQKQNSDENVFGELESDDPIPCYERQCSTNEHCCPGQICYDVDGITGSCVFIYGRRAGELCHKDSECESGLLCGGPIGGDGGARVCQVPAIGEKQYGELCHSSSQCDIARGLCCTLQRRHRQAPRRVCSYFKDPLVCIGPVASDQIKNTVEHTAGEKRITGYKHRLNQF